MRRFFIGLFLAVALDHPAPAQSTWQSGTLYEPVGSVAVSAWQPVQRQSCTQTETCVVPQVGSGGIAGIALESGAPGSWIHVLSQGRAICTFSNQPVMADSALFRNGLCYDDPRSKSQVTSVEGFGGKVLRVLSSTQAEINVTAPGAMGDLVVASGIDQTSMAAFVQQNQNTSAGPAGATGATGPQGATGATGPQGPSGSTYVGSCTVSQTATVAIALGPRTISNIPCNGVVAGGSYFVSPSSAPPAGYGVFANAQGTAANQLSVTVYAPALVIGGTYSIPLAVWKMN